MNHHQLERDRLLRAERLPIYQRLIASARIGLNETLKAWCLPNSEAGPRIREAVDAWIEATSEVQLIGSSDVLNKSQSIDVRMRDLRDRAMERGMERFVAGNLPPEESNRLFVTDLEPFGEESGVKDELTADLIRACRADIERFGLE